MCSQPFKTWPNDSWSNLDKLKCDVLSTFQKFCQLWYNSTFLRSDPDSALQIQAEEHMMCSQTFQKLHFWAGPDEESAPTYWAKMDYAHQICTSWWTFWFETGITPNHEKRSLWVSNFERGYEEYVINSNPKTCVINSHAKIFLSVHDLREGIGNIIQILKHVL